jgi:hypothetical protein
LCARTIITICKQGFVNPKKRILKLA